MYIRYILTVPIKQLLKLFAPEAACQRNQRHAGALPCRAGAAARDVGRKNAPSPARHPDHAPDGHQRAAGEPV